MITHVARIGIFTVDNTGARIDKSNSGTNAPSINTLKSTSLALLVIPDTALPSYEQSTVNPNTSGYPTLKAYLELEAAGGFKLRHLDQSFVITDNG